MAVKALPKKPKAKQEAERDRRRLILKTGLPPGDVLTLTAAVESLHASYPGEYLTDVRTCAPEIWHHNPHVTPIAESEGELLELGYPSIQHCNQRSLSFLGGYTADLGRRLGRPLELTTNRPHLYLGEEERGWMNQVRERLPQNRDRPFWLLNAGVKKDYPAKQWPIEHFQEVVDRSLGRILWVQVGSKEHDHPILKGALSLVGETDFRQLIRLAYHAAGGLGPVTCLQHLMAAWQKPYICLLGGREPAIWTQYPFQHTLHTLGTLDCCRQGACWKDAVVPDGDRSLCQRPVIGWSRPAAECMAAIRPAEVLALLERLISNH